MGTVRNRARAGFAVFGGASRDRTGDLYNAIVALSQLSYGPVTTVGSLGMGQQRVNLRR